MKYAVHEVRENGWGIGQAKGDYQIFQMSISTFECSLMDICVLDADVMVAVAQV